MAGYNWKWGILFQEPYLGWLISGALTTVVLALTSWTIAVVMGTVIGIGRTVPFAPFRWLFKNTSIALTNGVAEITARSRQIESYTFQGYEAFTAATILYLLVSMSLLLVTRGIEARTRIPGMIVRDQATNSR